MQGMDGLGLQRYVRLKRLELLSSSSQLIHDDEVERCAFAEGAASFIRKPFGMPRNCFERSRQLLSEASGTTGPQHLGEGEFMAISG